MHKAVTRTLASSLALVVAMGATAALAEWPDHPITMIVPYNPGGTTDILARQAADAIAAAVGQPVVVENRPGAGGVVGATQAAQTEGDGYTIFFGNNATQVIQPLINPAVTYDPLTDFVGIATVADAASFLAVNADLQIHTLAEFVTYLQAHEDATYGTAGVGSMGQFTTEMLMQAAGTHATHIPYQGSNNAMAAVMSGEIDFMADPVAATQSDSDRLRIIAALTAERHPNLPDIPTAREQGVDVAITGWFGVWAPDGTDAAQREAMAAPLRALVASDAYREQVLRMGLLPNFRDPSETDAAVADSLTTFGAIRDAAGISIE